MNWVEGIKRFFEHSYKVRYINKYGMELYPAEIDFHGKNLGYAYGDYSKGLFREDGYGFDDKNVFIFKKNGTDYYNPCGIAEYALICFGEILFNSGSGEKNLYQLKSQVDWLIKNAAFISEKKALWWYDYPNEERFFSGISQGMIISVMLRAYQFFEDKQYLNLAWGAYYFLVTPIKAGGVMDENPPFDIWFEEYLGKPKILNGHIYALLGIWDLYRVTGNPVVKEKFQKGIGAIKRNIKKFDLGFFTKYEAFSKYPANNSYHYTHITLFRILYQITDDHFFKKYADKFQRYHDQKIYKVINFMYLLSLTIFARISSNKQ